MSIVFFGTPEFAVPSLKALMIAGEDIALVVTQADKVKGVKGGGHRLSQPPVKAAALEAGLTVAQPDRLKDESFLAELTSIGPEFIITVAYGKILPKTVLDLPRRGCINVHASLLPNYRGAAPIAWAIINGERRTGVTTMRMDEGLDTGDIIMTRDMEITMEDTAGSLGERLSRLGASLLVDTINGMRSGSITPVPQIGAASYAPPLKKEDGHVDWSKSSTEIYNFIRGMQPWPGAFCIVNNERVSLLKTLPADGTGSPGVIARISKDSFFIATGHGLLAVLELQPAGKKPMPASAFISGRRLAEGTAVL